MRLNGPLVVALLAVPAAPAAAKDAPKADDSPEAVIRASLAAWKDRRDEDYARLTDPDDRRKFKEAMLDAGRSIERAGNTKAFVGMFAGAGQSVADLARLDDVKFLAAFLGGPARKHLEGSLPRDGKVTILGQVPEGDDTVHVVVRGTLSDDGVSITVPALASLRKTAAGWRVRMEGAEAIAALMKRAVGEPATEAPGVKGKPARPPEGEWELHSWVAKGNRIPWNPKDGEVLRLRLTDTTWTSEVPAIKRVDKYKAAFSEANGVLRVDLHIDEPADKVERGIWKVEGDTLTVCLGLPGEPRPADFTCPVGAKRNLFVYKRVKKD